MPRPPTIPERSGQAIRWCQMMASRWSEHKATLQLTDEQLATMQALTDEAAQARQELQQARDRYRAAAAMSRARTAAMRTQAGGLLGRIRAVARTSQNPQAIYSAAHVRPPVKRSPSPAPGRATRFDVQLVCSSGTLRIDFECPHPRGVRGVTYRVERSIWSSGPDGTIGGAGTPFEYFTTARKRSFVDKTIPPGAVIVVYKVTAQTPTRDGPVAIHMVRLAGEDAVVASPLVARQSAAKRAA